MTRKGILPQILVIREGVIIRTFLGWHPTMTLKQLRETVLPEPSEKSR